MKIILVHFYIIYFLKLVEEIIKNITNKLKIQQYNNYFQINYNIIRIYILKLNLITNKILRNNKILITPIIVFLFKHGIKRFLVFKDINQMNKIHKDLQLL